MSPSTRTTRRSPSRISSTLGRSCRATSWCGSVAPYAPTGGSATMILGRLGVRDKLNLLLLLPLTASTARTAQQAGSLIQELQRERLLSLAYLVSPGANRSPLISQAQNVSDQAADMRGALGPRVERGLSAALAGLDRLGPIRDRVRQRSVEPKLVHQAFDDAITGLLDALGLTPQNFVDAVGARQVGALDALLRANEESGSAGTALLVAALDQA